MYRFRTAAAAALTLAVAACSDAPAGPEATPTPLPLAQQNDAVVPGEVLVKMKEGFELDALQGREGLSFSRSGYKSEFAVMGVERGQERAEAARLMADPRVEWAEPNYIRQTQAIDPRLWAFYNPGGLNAYFNETDSRAGQPLGATYASLSARGRGRHRRDRRRRRRGGHQQHRHRRGHGPPGARRPPDRGP